MSESARNLPKSDVSNEDVINELTKDLESSLKTDGQSDDTSKENCEPLIIEPKDDDNCHPDFVINSDKSEKSTKESKDTKEFNDNFDDDESDKHSDDDDDVDEVALKDNEVNLSDTEKEALRIKAEKHKIDGNERFKLTNYEAAIECYTEGLKICPLSFPKDRATLYCNRAAAKINLTKDDSAVKDCSKAIEMDPTYVKAYYRRAQSYETLQKYDESLADFNKILELDPQHQHARRGVLRLPPLIEERNEKLKTEMLGKLKDLGNMVLRPFGLSTENFKMVQDPETKGYSISFSQNK